MTRRRLVATGVVAAVVLAVVGGALYTVIRYKPAYQRSGSMTPTIRPGQLVLVDRFAYRRAPPQRGDVVIFMPPRPTSEPYFKRVVAVPGDRFVMHAGRTFVNGKRIDEPYVRDRADYELAVRDYSITVDGARLDTDVAFVPPRADWTSPDTVPRGCYVMLGDERPNSYDSHAWGFFCPGRPVPNEPNVHPELIGRAIVTSR